MIESAIYQGVVTHRRFYPKPHEFSYKMYMALIDLDEIDLLSKNTKFKIMSFNPEQYLKNQQGTTLKQKALSKLQEHMSLDGTEKIYLLTQLRSLGILFNPVNFYYIKNKSGLFMLAEVNNTPWLENHIYTLINPEIKGPYHQYQFQKKFHVSPFLPMDFTYHLKSIVPGENIFVHMENWHDDKKAFDATLALNRYSWSQQNFDKIFVKHPFSTLKVIAAIYWQALKIYLKGNPFYSHP